MALKKLGVWTWLDGFTAQEAAAFAKRVEAWGYGALWYPEALGRESMAQAAWLLANTAALTVATGIANIYARDAVTAAAAYKTLNEQSGGRFLMGLGVSHIPLVEGLRKHSYSTKPVETMRGYLDAMDGAPYQAPLPAQAAGRVLAALGPKMTALAGARTQGSHPYNTHPEHTAEARKILGPGKLLAPEQAVVLESDPAKARATARKFLARYVVLPNYFNNWKRFGFTDADLENGGSDRLIDAIIAWGDEKAIRTRIDAHFAAGADHVSIQALSDGPVPDERVLALLAPGA